jgi:hypothetical protein
MKLLKAVPMWRAQGCHVILYGPDEIECEPDEHVVITTEADRLRWGYGGPTGYDTTKPFLWDASQPYWFEANTRTIDALKERLPKDRRGHLLCLIAGWTQQPIAHAVAGPRYNNPITVEWGVGYEGIFSEFCFAPETPVRTKRGLIPISEIKSGDEVLSRGGVYRRVKRVLARPHKGEIIQLSTTCSLPMRVTANHPLSVLVDSRTGRPATKPQRPDRNFSYEYREEWVSLEDLEVGNYVRSVAPTEDSDTSELDLSGWIGDGRRRNQREALPLTDDVLWMLGFYCAEGSTSTGQINFATHYKEHEYRSRLRRVFEQLGCGVREQDRREFGGQCVALYAYSTQLSLAFSKWFGRGCENKALPPELLNLPLRKIVHVLQGVLDGDGCERFNSIGQTSPLLAQQIVEIRLRMKGHPMLSSKAAGGKKDVHTVVRAFDDEPFGREELHGGSRHRHPRGWWDYKGASWAKITSKESAPYDGIVYDLEMEGDEPSFVVGNILVHNCAFESYAWMHHVYGLQRIINGRAFDQVIPNFFDASQFSVARKPSADYLLYIGRIIQRKGPHIAAEIAKRAGLPLLVAGPGALEVSEGRILGTDNVEILGDVHHIGPVGFARRNELMQNAAAVIVPTVYIEPFGGVAVEAMLAGAPVVASDWGSFTEIVTPNVGRRFRTLAQGAQAVKEVGNLDRKKIRKHALDHYSLEAVGPMFMRYFDQLDSLWRRGWYD